MEYAQYKKKFENEIIKDDDDKEIKQLYESMSYKNEPQDLLKPPQNPNNPKNEVGKIFSNIKLYVDQSVDSLILPYIEDIIRDVYDEYIESLYEEGVDLDLEYVYEQKPKFLNFDRFNFNDLQNKVVQKLKEKFNANNEAIQLFKRMLKIFINQLGDTFQDKDKLITVDVKRVPVYSEGFKTAVEEFLKQYYQKEKENINNRIREKQNDIIDIGKLSGYFERYYNDQNNNDPKNDKTILGIASQVAWYNKVFMVYYEWYRKVVDDMLKDLEDRIFGLYKKNRQLSTRINNLNSKLKLQHAKPNFPDANFSNLNFPKPDVNKMPNIDLYKLNINKPPIKNINENTKNKININKVKVSHPIYQAITNAQEAVINIFNNIFSIISKGNDNQEIDYTIPVGDIGTLFNSIDDEIKKQIQKENPEIDINNETDIREKNPELGKLSTQIDDLRIEIQNKLIELCNKFNNNLKYNEQQNQIKINKNMIEEEILEKEEIPEQENFVLGISDLFENINPPEKYRYVQDDNKVQQIITPTGEENIPEYQEPGTNLVTVLQEA